jgi:hypothetical protein
MPGLDRDQAAKSLAQHKDWPDPQRATGSEEHDTEPANRIAVDRPQLFAIRVCRQIRVKKSNYGEDGNDSPVAAGFAHPGAQMSSGEERYHREREQHHHERYQCWVREERTKPTPTHDRKTGIRASTKRNER